MNTKYRKHIYLVILFFILPACSTHNIQPNKNSVLIDNIPFYPQEVYQCGPASLAGVLNYWGVETKPEDIAKDIYSKSAKGTLNIDMVLYVNKKGLYPAQYSGGWDDLKQKIDNGYPLIVLVDYGFLSYQANHFMVVIGYNDAEVVVNSGLTEKIAIDKDKFLKIWKKTDFWTLWIKQRSSEQQ